MNRSNTFIATVSLTLLTLCTPIQSSAQQAGTLQIAALSGTAHAGSSETEPPKPAMVGTRLQVGSTLRTGPRSVLDLFLSNEAGTLRLTQNSTLKIVRFDTEEIHLHLTTGSVLGLGNQVAKDKPYYIRVSNGWLDTHARQFRVNASGLIVGVDGELAFAHIDGERKVTTHTMSCPPISYFWAPEGIKPAPPALVEEVRVQLNTQIPAR